MKIAIVGAGFYGARIAKVIKKTFKSSHVTIYEKNNQPFKEAVVNNQHRLHLGFHYPRCNETIIQANSSFQMFMSEYPECVYDIRNNLYIIHNESKVSLSNYLNVFDRHKIDYKLLRDYNNPILKNKHNYEGFVSTDEKKIDLRKLTERLRSSFYLNNIITRY